MDSEKDQENQSDDDFSDLGLTYLEWSRMVRVAEQNPFFAAQLKRVVREFRFLRGGTCRKN